jgi:hypothetical protein
LSDRIFGEVDEEEGERHDLNGLLNSTKHVCQSKKKK